jgi:hypothetical protein
VTVRYLLGDSAYSTDRVSLTDEDGDFTWASSVVAAHPNGQAVTVWYDQAHPGSAFLVRPTQSRTGVIWFVVLVAVLILSVRAGHFMPRWKPRNIA